MHLCITPCLHHPLPPSPPGCLLDCALQGPLVQAKYGFLYASYSERLPYWETTEMVRKFAIAFIPVSGAQWRHVQCVWAIGRGGGAGVGAAAPGAALYCAACPALSPPPLPSPLPCAFLTTHFPPTLSPARPQVFIPAQVEGSLQAACAQVVMLVYIMLTMRLWPFATSVDNWLQLASLTGGWSGVGGGQLGGVVCGAAACPAVTLAGPALSSSRCFCRRC